MLRKTYRIRLLLLCLITLLVFAIIEATLVWIQIRRHKVYRDKARRQQSKTVELIPRRGNILDRNGLPLATSHFSDTIVLDGLALQRHLKKRKLAAPPPELITDIATTIHAPVERIEDWCESKRSRILVRKAEVEVSQRFAMIEDRHGLPPGVIVYQQTGKRRYPNDALASHLLGFTKIDDHGDNIGLAGLELEYNSWLKGSYGKEKLPINSQRKELAPMSDDVIEATYGRTLVLTIDQQIQMFTERALREGVGETQARAGVAVVLDVRTGEVLALANCPDFDPNAFSRADPAQRRNRALTDPFEIGSVMKIMTTALLFDHDLVTVDELVDCKKGYAVIDGRIFRDSHPLAVIPFHEVFAESSNIGMATLVSRLEPEIHYRSLRRFGLGQSSGIDLPGENKGVLYPLEKWDRYSQASLAIGYETMLTALQVCSAVAALGNDGWRMRPYIVREIQTPKGQTLQTTRPERIERVASSLTSSIMLELMEEVVEHGTGKRARIPGYRIAGKTGTTRKHEQPEDPDEPRRYFASFAGLIPAVDPRLAVFVSVDEPRTAKYGGTVSAPIFRKIAEGAVHILGIEPDDPEAFEFANRTGDIQTEEVAEDLVTDADLSAWDPSEEVDVAVIEGVEGDEDDAMMLIMPDCMGLTMVEAVDLLADHQIQAQLRGSGIAVRQDPPAGARFSQSTEPLIIFAHPSSQATK